MRALKDIDKSNTVLFTCEECGTQKDSFRKLWNHQRCHKTFKCRKCDKQISYANRGRHAKLCKGKKSSQKCDKCEYSTTSTSKMERHKQRLHPVPVQKPAKESPQCQYCGKVFMRKQHCKDHEAKYCRVRNLQLNDSLTPLTDKEAMQWHSSTNMTKKDWSIILSLMEKKWGNAIIHRGTKV